MADLIIPDNLAEELQTLADQENRSVPELLESMMEQYHGAAQALPAQTDPFLQMADAAAAANLEFTDNNAAARTREILESEFADYLLKRMRGEDANP